MQAMNSPKITVRIAPRLRPDRPAIAVASCPNICVNVPVECSFRSKNAAFCRRIALKHASRTRRTYINNIINGKTMRCEAKPKFQPYKAYAKSSTIATTSHIAAIRFDRERKYAMSGLINANVPYANKSAMAEYAEPVTIVIHQPTDRAPYSPLLNPSAYISWFCKDRTFLNRM